MITTNPASWRGRRLAGVVAAAALAVGACGLSTSDEPEPISTDKVPPELREPDTVNENSIDTAEDAVVVDAWYLRTTEDRTTLQPVQRRVTPPATAAARLEALLAGPTTQENGAGISTAIPSGTTLSERPREVGNVLTVSLSRQFYDDLRGESARNAFAQVVFTATEIAGVDSVQFVLDREPFPAIDGQREQRNGPLGRDDYQSLLDG